MPKQVKRAQEHDVSKVINNFQEAVSAKHLYSITCGTDVFKLDALHCRTGYYGICFIVRGDRSTQASPVVAKTGDIGRYFEDLANKPLLHMLDDLDVWCANGLSGMYFMLFPHDTSHPNLYRTGMSEEEIPGLQKVLSEPPQDGFASVNNPPGFTD